jgi:hypothetical protein
MHLFVCISYMPRLGVPCYHAAAFLSNLAHPDGICFLQMGSHYRPTIFGDHVQHHIKGWAKRHKAQRPPEPNKLHTAIGSVLNVLNADSVFSKKQSDLGEDSANTFTSEDVNEVRPTACAVLFRDITNI